MKVLQILQNPLIKIAGISAILYFGLFHQNENPESLKQRLDPDRIKKEIDQAKMQTHYIMSNLSEVQNLQSSPNSLATKPQEQKIKEPAISTNDIVLGNSHQLVQCGDEILIDYKVYNVNGVEIDQKNNIKLIAKNDQINAIAKYLIEARNGGIRQIDVPFDFATTNEEILEYRKKASGAFKYQVTIKEVNSANAAQNCL